MDYLRYASVAAFAVIALFLLLGSGCISTLGNLGCGFVPDGHDRDECYQGAAVAATDASLCEKITGAGFTGSDPPKDKCYLRVANATNDASLCAKMEGGEYSYEPSECYNNVAINTGDISLCDNVPAFDGGYSTMNINKANCIRQAKASPNYKAPQEDGAQNGSAPATGASASGAGNSPTSASGAQPTSSEQGQPAASAASATTSAASATTGARQPAPIQDAPTTDSQKSAAIASSGTTPADPTKIDGKTGQILVNLPPSAKSDIASATSSQQAAVASTPAIPEPAKTDEEKPEGYLSKAWSWVTWGAGKTKDTYEGAGDEAPKGTGALDTAGKLTEGYKDATEISDSFNAVNAKINSSAITQSQGKLLKVGYGLGKAIKWTAKNVPVVGDAVGDAADGAFQAGMKAGEKIAEHTTKINKCIDDPLSDDCIN